jgi:two-component system NtrC family sensor kinase
MKVRQEAVARSFKLMMAGTAILPLVLFCYWAWQSYGSTFRLADERIERSLDISLEHAGKVFQTIEVVFASIDEIARGRTDLSLRLHEAELSERLKHMASAISDVRSIWMFDVQGIPIATSRVYPVPTNLNNSDRDYFVAQLDKNMGTYVGRILVPRIGSDIFFSVSKKRFDSSGEFSGVTAVVVSPTVFEGFYERLAKNTGASYALIRNDGEVLARYPLPAKPGIILDKETAFRQTIATHPEGGQYTTVSGVDGIERRFSVHRLGQSPLYVTASLEVAEIREEWNRWIKLQLGLGIPVILLLLCAEYIAFKRTRDFYAEAARREAVESSLRQSQKMEAVGQLTGGIAHDFNNLLTIIIGNLQSISRQIPDGSKVSQKLSNALTGAQRAAQLTHRLLAFSRRQPLDPKPVDANKLLSQVSELLARSLGERVQIETVGSAGLWQIEADVSELEAAIINLAINARDAMPDGGKITIETSNVFLDDVYCANYDGVDSGQYVLISVSDEGAGMAPEVIEKAFDPFFTTKDPGLGTGLGLSQVYGFARQSAGHVKIYSEVGVGTSVKLYLPRSFNEEADGIAPAKKASIRGKGECILVVEDDEGVRNYLVELLIDLNYSVKAAPSGDTAVPMIEDSEQKIDLLLTDVVMPGMNGRQLAEIAAAKRPSMKVLYMTGYSRNAIVHQGRLDPGVSLIQKPISEEVLAGRISALLSAS